MLFINIPNNLLVKLDDNNGTILNSSTTNISIDKNSSHKDSNKSKSDIEVVVIANDLEEDEGIYYFRILDYDEDLMRKYRKQEEKIKEMAEDSIRKEQHLKEIAQSINNLISQS